jgi:hypothetical protein
MFETKRIGQPFELGACRAFTGDQQLDPEPRIYLCDCFDGTVGALTSYQATSERNDKRVISLRFRWQRCRCIMRPVDTIVDALGSASVRVTVHLVEHEVRYSHFSVVCPGSAKATHSKQAPAGPPDARHRKQRSMLNCDDWAVIAAAP